MPFYNGKVEFVFTVSEQLSLLNFKYGTYLVATSFPFLFPLANSSKILVLDIWSIKYVYVSCDVIRNNGIKHLPLL